MSVNPNDHLQRKVTPSPDEVRQLGADLNQAREDEETKKAIEAGYGTIGQMGSSVPTPAQMAEELKKREAQVSKMADRVFKVFKDGSVDISYSEKNVRISIPNLAHEIKQMDRDGDLKEGVIKRFAEKVAANIDEIDDPSGRDSLVQRAINVIDAIAVTSETGPEKGITHAAIAATKAIQHILDAAERQGQQLSPQTSLAPDPVLYSDKARQANFAKVLDTAMLGLLRGEFTLTGALSIIGKAFTDASGSPSRKEVEQAVTDGLLVRITNQTIKIARGEESKENLDRVMSLFTQFPRAQAAAAKTLLLSNLKDYAVGVVWGVAIPPPSNRVLAFVKTVGMIVALELPSQTKREALGEISYYLNACVQDSPGDTILLSMQKFLSTKM